MSKNAKERMTLIKKWSNRKSKTKKTKKRTGKKMKMKKNKRECRTARLIDRKTEKDTERERVRERKKDCFACVHIHLQLILFLKSAVVGDSSAEGAIPSKQGEPSPPPIQTR